MTVLIYDTTHLITPSVHHFVRISRRQIQTGGRSGVVKIDAQPAKHGHQQRRVICRVVRHRLANFLSIEVCYIFIITPNQR